MGGKKVKEKRGPQFYAQIGKKGGESTKLRQGSEFYSRIGKKGGERGRVTVTIVEIVNVVENE
jgi:general stress protein YciG